MPKAATVKEEPQVVEDSQLVENLPAEVVNAEPEVITSPAPVEVVDTLDDPVEDVNAWRRPYEELGFSEIETREDAQQRAIEKIQQQQELLREAQEQAHYYRSMAHQFGQGSKESQPPAPESGVALDPFDRLASEWVDLDANMLTRYVTQDESGVAKWREDTPPDLREQWGKAEGKRQEWLQMISDPRKLSQAIDQRVSRLMEDRLNGALSERDTQMEDRMVEEQFLANNPWIYDRDPATKQILLGWDGKEKVSREGQRFLSALNHVREQGVTRISSSLELAMDRFRAQQLSAQQAPAQQRESVQPVIQQQRRQMLGVTNPNAGSASQQTVVDGINNGRGAETTGQKRKSAVRQAFEALAEEGMSFGT